MPLVIAVDGPAASGKGSIASRLAAWLGLPHLDTGLLYRAVGMAVLRAGGDLDDADFAAGKARALRIADLQDPDLIGRAAGDAASRVALHPPVRAALLDLQKDFAFEAVHEDIRIRDARDADRDAAPMTRAPDAVLLDTTEMDIEAAFDAARRIVEAARGS